MLTFPTLGKSGRLGNQLFEIASTLGIASRYGKKVIFPEWDYSPFFLIDEHLFRTMTAELEDVTKHPALNHIDPRARTYMQDYNLWRNISHRIWLLFQPSFDAGLQVDELWNENISTNRDTVALHIRRGDNLRELQGDSGWHPLIPESYYRDALRSFSGCHPVVFSDDIDWCLNTFQDLDATFIRGTARPPEHLGYADSPILDWIDLFLMAKCDYHIIANSTYSWWGAFLSNDTSPVRPKPWFGPKLDYINPDLMFPSLWRTVAWNAN